MDQKSLRGCVLLASLLVGGALLIGKDSHAQEGCVSDKCHAKLLKAANLHAPAETCESCHESVETPHPRKGQKTFKLTQDLPGMCSICHGSFGEKRHVHPPAKEGLCTMCHNPHSSDEPKLLTQPMKDLCGTCHADHVDFKVAHGPVSAGACTACHTPHESDTKNLLVKEGQEVCFGCHLDMPEVAKKKNVHPPLQAGCTSCHNPHGSDHPKFLAEEGAQLCFLCHAEIGEKINESPVAHVAVSAGCQSCHSPHASDNPKLLERPEKDTCVACHDAIITKNMTVFHGPINNGKCTGCHDPHGGQFSKLLPKEFPAEAYVPYTGAEFEFCFGCHKRDLLQYPETSFATNFRNGETNLHYVHVNNKQKGRGCRLCHAIHGSPNPKLLADSVPFGKWNLPLKFVKTETGGGCSPGCHKPQYYDRQSPGRKPEATKPAPKAD